MAHGKGFSKLMDTSMAENMQTLKGAAANGSNTDKVSKQHSQITKIFEVDKSISEGRK